MQIDTDKQTFGRGGNLTIPSGTTVIGDFCAIQCIGAVTFDILEDSLEKTTAEYGTKATGTITVGAGATTGLTVGDYIEIGDGVAPNIKLTAVAEDATPTPIQFKIGTNRATATANLLAAINANPSIAALVVGTNTATGVITTTALTGGTGGNAYTLVKSGTNLAVSGANLAGGANLAAAVSLTYAHADLLVGRFTKIKPSAGHVRVTLTSYNP